MYGTKAAFDYITVGGRCAYETNKVFEFPVQTFHACSCLYTTEHDDILCTFMDTLSYVEVLFGSQIESAKYYMLRLVYFAKNVNSLNLNITWKKEGDPSFCGECYEHVTTTVSSNKFLHIDIDLRQNSEWVGNITNLRVGVYNTEIVPLFIRYLSVYSPTTYKCSKPACPYYSNYSTPCTAGKDLHILSGVVFEENSVNIVSNSSFSFTVYGIDFIVEIDNNNYFLNNILNEINEFFKTMPVPGLSINLDENRIKLTCNYIKPVIKYTEISEKLGFFDVSGKDISTYTIETSGSSDYIDIAGNLKGVYKTTNLKDLNFSKTFSIGFKDAGDMVPGSTFEFLDQTVIFHTLVVQFDGYINCFEIYCKALSGAGKILIFRRDGDTYTVVNSYNINATTYMEKQTIDWACNVYKGDVIGIYNLKLYISKKAPNPVNHYGVVSGYSSSINKISIEDVSFSAVSLYAYFKQPTANDIPIIATYNEVAYVDRVSFLLKYDDSDLSFFNVIYNNTFGHEISGCQINVKDSLNVVTEVPGEVIDLECLSNGTFFATEADSQLDISDAIPPIFLSSIEDRDVLRYSWAEIITNMYKNNNYTYTFIAGDVFFYYEFPTTIDICKVILSSEAEEAVDNYLLKVLDNTKTFPSFSNVHDVIILDTQIKNWGFDIEGCISTKGIGVFVYNYGELPNISFAEIEFYTSVGSIPEYIIEVTATTYDNYIVPFSLDTNGTRNNAYVGSHVKNLTFNVGFIADNMLFDFSDINIYSSYVPDDYFVSESSSGEGTLKVYNTRAKALKCYLLDYNIDLLNNLIYEYDFDNEFLHRGFVPTKYTHDKFYFTSSNYLNNKYTTYALKNLINIEDFFITKFYNFNSQEYDDWYVPYDYLVPGYDGQFIYIDGGLTLRPLGSEAIRWFNYINTNEFYNDIDIELRFDYVGNMEDFVFIGITCCDRDYNNYLKFFGAFQFSPEYGLEFQLEGEPEPTYYKFAAILGRDAGLKINKRGSSWTFSCFYSGEWHKLTTFSLFDTEILISISTLFNAPAVKGNVIAEFKTCNINASKIIHGKKVWYTVNDGLSYVYGGCVLDNSTILDNISKPLTFPRECTVEKFIYDFNNLSTRYLKFVNTQIKSIKITEIKCYLDDVLVPIKQGLISYSDDLFFGTLKGETDYLDDNVIINENFSESICRGADDVLSAVGVEFNSNVGVNKAVVYYIKETGSYEPLRVIYSYDNVIYYDVYDNFSLFSKTFNTSVHCLFNEFSGYKGINEIIYEFVSNSQYSTDFSVDGVQEYKWMIQSPYVVDSGGVWLKNITGPESLYSKFSIDGDFIIDVCFDSFSNYSSGDARVYLKAVFKNNTEYEDVYIYQDFDSDNVYVRGAGLIIEVDKTFGEFRIKREGSVFCCYYRRYGTTWYELSSSDYGYDYIYPVDIYVYVSGANSFDLRIKKVLIIDGTGISDTDFLLIEAPSENTLFVRGRQFSDTNTYAVAERWQITELSYPFSFSLLGSIISSIPEGGLLVKKSYDLGLTYEEKDLSLWWFSEYFTNYKIEDILSYSSDVNTIASVSVGDYNIDENLFTSTSDQTIKAIYKSRYDVNTIIDETFKTGEGTFDTVFSGSGSTEYMSDDFTGNDGDLYNQTLWSGSVSNIEIKDNKLYIEYCADHVYVDTKYTPVDDFNVQVDFSAGPLYHGFNYWSQGLVVCFENGDSFSIDYKQDGSFYDDLGYVSTTYIEGVSTVLCGYDEKIMFGKFRITKKGNTLSSYFLQNKQWSHLIDWVLVADTVVSGIRLEHKVWSISNGFECYFDNFVINDDFDFYNDVRADGSYSYIDGNYIELIGSNVHTNKVIRSINALTFECSVTVDFSPYTRGVGLCVSNAPFCENGRSETSCKSIHVSYDINIFVLYTDGVAHSNIYGSTNTLFYPVYGQTYIIGIKFIPGTGTLVYWFGPTSGYLMLDYSIDGDLYAWWGNDTGKGIDTHNHVSRVHRFKCFEDRILYKELKNTWIQSVGVDDVFIASDGSSPNSERWAINGSPKVYSNSLKLMSVNEDKIQSKVFFCAPFEVLLEYNNLSFGWIEGLALSLNVECYDSCKNIMFGVSKFKVGYSGGVGAWVNYYCNDSSGNSSIYHISDVSNRKLKIVNDGYNIQYLLSDGDNWITVLSLDCTKQYYYKIAIEGTDSGVVAYLNDITIDSEDFMSPTDAVALIPTAWKFSPTKQAYQNIIHVNLNELIDKCRHFSIDVVAKIDDSMFLSYIEMDKELVSFDGAKVVGDNYITLISAMAAAKNGEVIYVLPGTYEIGGYTIDKKIIIVGVGDYNDIIITINGDSVNLDGCEIIFKNITIVNQLEHYCNGFVTQGDKISYFTMDNCKYSMVLNTTHMLKVVGTKECYLYLRHSYINLIGDHALVDAVAEDSYVIVDIFNCRIPYSDNCLLFDSTKYIMRSEVYANSSVYEPKVINTVPIFTLFSPNKDTNVYLSTPIGLEKIIKSKENEFNYLSFGNSSGGIVFYGGDNDYCFSEYFMSSVDSSFKLFIQGYVDTIRVFDRYQTYYETLNNINTVGSLGIDLKLAHNNTIIDYKIYEPLNQYNSNLELGRNTPSTIDEFIWSKTVTSSSSLLKYYNNYLKKLGFLDCNIQIDSAKFKFFIDFGSNIGVGSLIQSVLHNFTNTVCYSDGVSDPALLNTTCSLSEARWYSLYNDASQHVSDLTPGNFSVFPSISGCDESRWEYTGESGYIDVLPDSVLNVSSNLNDVYNIKWKRNKTNINEYFVSSFSDFLTISLKLFGAATCDRIEIKSGYNIGTEIAGYITKCSILIDGVSRFSIDNNINSVIIADFSSILFSTIDIVIEEVEQVSDFVFNDVMLTGNAVFINYVKVLSGSSSRTFDNTLCNVYEFDSLIKLDFIDTSKTGTCSLDYCYSEQGADGCIATTVMDLNSPPNSEIRSVLVKSDNLYDCGFVIDEYTVDILSELMKSSINSWKVYVGDVEIYEELFYLQSGSTSVGFRFFKETVFEVGTYYEDFGTNIEWAITDELVLNIYASNPISSFYICIGNKTDGIYYRWDFSLVVGWNNLRFNFYDTYVTRYSFNVLTERLLFNDLAIFNVWCGGIYQHGDGFVVLDNVFVDRSSVPNALSSHKDAFYIPVSFESESGSIHMDYKSYWDNDGLIFGDMLSDKTVLSVFGNELCFSLVNKINGKFVLGMYSYKHNVRTVKMFGYASKFDINDTIKLKLNWSCQGNQFSSDLYINGSMVGRVIFSLVETSKLKVTGVMVGGGSVYITSIYNSLSLCGQLKHIKVYSSDTESKLINDKLFIDGKNLVENSPMCVGEIGPSDFVELPVRYEGKSKRLSELNLHVKWVGVY